MTSIASPLTSKVTQPQRWKKSRRSVLRARSGSRTRMAKSLALHSRRVQVPGSQPTAAQHDSPKEVLRGGGGWRTVALRLSTVRLPRCLFRKQARGLRDYGPALRYVNVSPQSCAERRDARRSPCGSPRRGVGVAQFTSRLAISADVAALRVLMDAAIAELQRAFLDDAQIASSRTIMGIDSQLIDDGTYFVVESDDYIAGCGGWSRRATLYGGNQTPGRDSQLLDPTIDPARVRAMYTNPAYARRGVGRLILSLCEAAAAAEGFTRLELMSTLSGEPLYTAYGFRALERLEDATGGAPVPLVRMDKLVDPSLLG